MSTAVLTIDDIASVNTVKMVDYLCDRNICAVMFAVGQNVEKYYDEALYALKRGMIVGNHSYSHPRFSSLSLAECIEEIERNEEVLTKLYEDAKVDRLYRPIRFPYGDKGHGHNDGIAHYEALQEYLKKHNFNKLKDTKISYPWYAENKLNSDIDTFWTFDFGEYMMCSGDGFTKESVYERIHDKYPASGDVLLKEGNHHIILMHAHDETEAFMPEYYREFLDYIIAKGVRFERPEFFSRIRRLAERDGVSC